MQPEISCQVYKNTRSLKKEHVYVSLVNVILILCIQVICFNDYDIHIYIEEYSEISWNWLQSQQSHVTVWVYNVLLITDIL